MIDLYYWTTPNGHKITLFLEETGLPYAIHPINISQGDQFQADFLKVSPNNKIPAIVDRQPADGGAPLSLFESGAILLYLAEKTGRFLAKDLRARQETLQWLFWQMGGLGPMAGQNHHFNRFAPEKIPYAIDRYVKETARLYGVLDQRLADRAFVAGDDYSIADMAISVDRPAPVAGAGSRRLPAPAALVREHSPASGDATRLCFGGAHQSAEVASPEPACGRPRGRPQAELAQPCAPH